MVTVDTSCGSEETNLSRLQRRACKWETAPEATEEPAAEEAKEETPAATSEEEE